MKDEKNPIQAEGSESTEARDSFFLKPAQIIFPESLQAADRYSKTHMFKAYRGPLRYIGAPMFVLCSVADYMHMPEEAPSWLLVRLAVFAYVWISFDIIAKFSWARRRINYFLFTLICFVSFFCNLTIYDSGGVGSPYLPGLLVASSAFILMFRLGRLGGVLSQFIICGPGIAILFYLAEPHQMMDAFVSSTFYLCMVGVAAMGQFSGEELMKVWNRAQRVAKTELERHRRTEFLKKHFPPSIRQEVESGTFNLQRRTMLPSAVVGFADIIASSKISNSVDLETDWELKEKFIVAATQRATECGMVVLNQLGDGFLFLANYRNDESWTKNLLLFYEMVTADLETILESLSTEIGTIRSGIRFGVSSGPIMLGWIGDNQSYFTAMGPDVNLAARLCSVAGNNEIVLSSRAWHEMKSVISDKEVTHITYNDLKGFDFEVPAVHFHAAAEKKAEKSTLKPKSSAA